MTNKIEEERVVDIEYNPDGKGKLGKALCDSVSRETYDYLINKGKQETLAKVEKMIDEIKNLDELNQKLEEVFKLKFTKLAKRIIVKKIMQEIKLLEKESGYRNRIEVEAIEEVFRQIRLRGEIEDFKQKFMNKDIKYSPELNMLYKIFGHTDINKCSLRDLCSLGFNSNLIVRRDVELNDEDEEVALLR